jgi:hypothetical protein
MTAGAPAPPSFPSFGSPSFFTDRTLVASDVHSHRMSRPDRAWLMHSMRFFAAMRHAKIPGKPCQTELFLEILAHRM